MKQFIAMKEKVVGLNDVLVEKNEVGILEEKMENISSVFFVKLWQTVEIPNSKFDIIDVKETGDSFSKKICNICHKLLDTSEFDRNQNGINNRTVRRPSCRACRRVIDGVGVSSHDRRVWNKKKPNFEPFECPICQKRTIPGITSKVVLDHNHSTGKVRGWLCDSCNTGTGRFKDDISVMKRAIEYLELND